MRTSRIASAHTHAIAASIGSEFSAAAHHANAGTPSGVNSANVNGISSTGRQPRITYSARSSASDASSCSTTRLIAGPIQFNGASLDDAARDQERAGHHVAVVVVEQVRRRQQALGAGPADQDQVVPVEVAAERQHRADRPAATTISAAAARATHASRVEATAAESRATSRRYGEPVRTLVTGAAGFIGSTLVDRCWPTATRSSASTTSARASSDNIEQAERHDAYEFVKADIVDADLIGAARRHRPEVVFHLAAQIYGAPLGRRPAVRLRGQRDRHGPAGRGGAPAPGSARSCTPRRADPSTAPRRVPDQRGRAHRPGVAVRGEQGGGEVYLNMFRNLYDLDCSHIAPANVYGPRQDPHGEAGVVAIFAQALLSGKPTKIFGDGSDTRDYVFVDDVVDAFVRAVRRSGQRPALQHRHRGRNLRRASYTRRSQRRPARPTSPNSIRPGSATCGGPASTSVGPQRFWAGAEGSNSTRVRRTVEYFRHAAGPASAARGACAPSSATARASRAYRNSKSLNRM